MKEIRLMNIDNIEDTKNTGNTDAPSEPPKDQQEKGAKGSRQSRRERAILALLEQSSVERAAHAVGIHPSTLWRWLQQPEFQEALYRARLQTFSQALGRLQQGASAAVGTVFRIMADARASDICRLRAAKYVLDKSASRVELDALENLHQRVTTIERNSRGPKTRKA
jgi:Homeodomain-like domain